MHFVFYRTSDVFATEELLQQSQIGVEIVPTPVQDKAYCGVCILVQPRDVAASTVIMEHYDYIQIP